MVLPFPPVSVGSCPFFQFFLLSTTFLYSHLHHVQFATAVLSLFDVCDHFAVAMARVMVLCSRRAAMIPLPFVISSMAKASRRLWDPGIRSTACRLLMVFRFPAQAQETMARPSVFQHCPTSMRSSPTMSPLVDASSSRRRPTGTAV